MTETDCTCPYVDPKYWTTHYGAVEPGSMQEWDPGCPVHRADDPASDATTTPPCGHTDGWCGGPVNCTRNTGPTPAAIDPPEPDRQPTTDHDNQAANNYERSRWP